MLRVVFVLTNHLNRTQVFEKHGNHVSMCVFLAVTFTAVV